MEGAYNRQLAMNRLYSGVQSMVGGSVPVAVGETNFTSDANMVAYWMMEQATGADAVDGKASLTMAHESDGAGPTRESTLVKQGTYSCLYNDAAYETHKIDADASLPDTFPGKNTTGWTSSFSVGGWFRTDTIATDNQQIIKKLPSEEYSFQLLLKQVATVPKFWFRWSTNGESLVDITGGTTALVNTWYHVVGVFDNTANTIALYVNGVSDAVAVAAVGNLHCGPGAVYMGSVMSGYLDEVFVMNRALSASEVLSIHDHGLEGNR